ncbi:MAG TPA: AAA family ATPase, partial [Rikenellaceae bacterium]|nr:AAA family ATPase [Rikenellaceae bacterium]
MEKLFKRHDEEIAAAPMSMIRSMMNVIDWSSRLLIIKGAKGVGKSTLMQQYIKRNYQAGDRSVLYCSADSSYFST